MVKNGQEWSRMVKNGQELSRMVKKYPQPCIDGRAVKGNAYPRTSTTIVYLIQILRFLIFFPPKGKTKKNIKTQMR